MGVLHRERWSSLVAEQTGWTMVNRGICGDTTGGMLARFERDVLRQTPDVAILLGGGNDIIATGTDLTARSNFFALVQEVMAAGIQPVLATPIPYDAEKISPDWRRLTDFSAAAQVCRNYVEWVRQLAGVFHIPLADFYAMFEALPDFPGGWYLDGLHPGKEGHRRMAELMSGLLRNTISGLARKGGGGPCE